MWGAPDARFCVVLGLRSGGSNATPTLLRT